MIETRLRRFSPAAAGKLPIKNRRFPADKKSDMIDVPTERKCSMRGRSGIAVLTNGVEGDYSLYQYVSAEFQRLFIE